MKTLIAGTSYLKDSHRIWLAELWVELNKKLNPDTDLLLVDTKVDDEWNLDCPVLRYSDNIGHLTSTGRDGWGRSTMRAIEFAIDGEYDYVALYDADLIFCKAVKPIFEDMERSGHVACGVRAPVHNWLEGLLFFKIEWLRDTNFIAWYNWESHGAEFIPERHIERIIGPELTVLNLPGMRDDWNNVNPYTARRLTWLTHSANPECYRAMIRSQCPSLGL